MCPEHFRSGASKYFRFGTGYMRQGYSPSYPLRDERITEDRLKLANLFRRQFYILFGLGLLALTGMAVGALATWNVADPSFSHATDNPVTNALGYPGAVFSDIAMQFFGLASVPALLPLAVWSLLMMTRGGIGRVAKRSFAWLGAALLFAAIASCFAVPESWPMPIGLGGVFGDMILKFPGLFLAVSARRDRFRHCAYPRRTGLLALPFRQRYHWARCGDRQSCTALGPPWR